MNNSEKILKIISTIIEDGILTTQDAKKEILNNLRFRRDELIDKLKLVSREEFEVLKKIVQNQEKEIKNLKKNKKITKAKKS
jgi:BMFP domain-containing protein YqiC